MLIKVSILTGYKLDGLDGEVGKIKDFYFDDRHWTIRYLVADTGKWLPGRQVLISPHALGSVMSQEQSLAVKLNQKQIKDSPSLEYDKPVSRQFETAYYGYYGYPAYWTEINMMGATPHIVHDREEDNKPASSEKAWDAHLRSAHAVRGYHLEATDGPIGHIEDFIIDSEMWAIRYLVVDTKNWWSGKKVLVSAQWIDRVSWDESKVFTNLSRETIKQSPEYTEESLLTRDYEIRLHKHYNLQGYWNDESGAKTYSS